MSTSHNSLQLYHIQCINRQVYKVPCIVRTQYNSQHMHSMRYHDVEQWNHSMQFNHNSERLHHIQHNNREVHEMSCMVWTQHNSKHLHSMHQHFMERWNNNMSTMHKWSWWDWMFEMQFNEWEVHTMFKWIWSQHRNRNMHIMLVNQFIQQWVNPMLAMSFKLCL